MLLTIQTLQTFTYKDDQQEKYCDDEDDHDSYGDDGNDNEETLMMLYRQTLQNSFMPYVAYNSFTNAPFVA